jgi:hypothetical protein
MRCERNVEEGGRPKGSKERKKSVREDTTKCLEQLNNSFIEKNAVPRNEKCVMYRRGEKGLFQQHTAHTHFFNSPVGNMAYQILETAAHKSETVSAT